MALLDELTTAVEDYPTTAVEIEIVEVSVPGNVLNAGETGTFRVKVTNRGSLHLHNLKVKVKGLNGALVKNNGAAAPYVTEFVSGVFDRVSAHGGSELNTGSPFGFKAPSNAQPSRNLVRAELDDWDGDLGHILNAHSRPVAGVKGTYASPVAGL